MCGFNWVLGHRYLSGNIGGIGNRKRNRFGAERNRKVERRVHLQRRLSSKNSRITKVRLNLYEESKNADQKIHLQMQIQIRVLFVLVYLKDTSNRHSLTLSLRCGGGLSPLLSLLPLSLRALCVLVIKV